MSYLERGLMQQIDKIILDAEPNELAELQKIDIETQLDGVLFYDYYTSLHQKSQQKIQTKNKF
jgi:hypothetical protein